MTMVEKIKELLAERGIRQKEAAALIGLEEYQFSKVTHGIRALSAAELLGLCLVFQVSPDRFLECSELDGTRYRLYIAANKAAEIENEEAGKYGK